MTRLLSRVVYWLCSLWLLALPLWALWMLFQVDSFRTLMQGWLMAMDIDWESVTNGQMYALWGLTVAYWSVSYFTIFFVQRSFRSFARGEWFDLRSSRHLRSAATLMLVHVPISPLYLTLAGLLMTMQNPPGDRLLFMAFTTYDLRLLASGLVLWVLADLLVKGMQAENENRQFI